MIPVVSLGSTGQRLLGLPLERHLAIAAERAGLAVAPASTAPPISGDAIVVAPGAVVTHDVLSALARAPRPADAAVLDAAGVAARIDARWLDGAGDLATILAGRPSRRIAEGGVPAGERRRAEEALLRAGTKPLRPDDHLGAFTRELTLPVVRWLAPTGISPNAVTLAGLVVTVASAIPLAAGGYRWMLVGAALQWIGSMADAVDGKLARVTGRITARGGWLDTRIDEAYYLLLLGATVLGLAREHSPLAVGAVGLVTLSGLAVSLALVASMRRRSPDGRAAGFGRRVHATLDDPGDDRILWIGRHTIRLATRAGLPHVFLVFAVADALPLLGVLAAIGTHVAWVVILRIDRALARREVPHAA